LIVSVIKYTDHACAFGRDFLPNPLYQVQMTHECRPGVLTTYIAGIQQFLKDRYAEDESYPQNLHELREQGIILTITGVDDPLNVGFVQWRIAMCTDHDIMHLLNFIHHYVAYEMMQDKKLKDIVIHLSGPRTFVKPNDWTVKVEIQESVPFSPLAAYPPNGTKVILATIEVDETTTICGMLFGQTYSLKDALEAHGMFGTSMIVAGNNEYVRLFGDINTENDNRVQWLIDGLTKLIQNSVVQLRVANKPGVTPNAQVQRLLRRLGDIPTIFVVS